MYVFNCEKIQHKKNMRIEKKYFAIVKNVLYYSFEAVKQKQNERHKMNNNLKTVLMVKGYTEILKSIERSVSDLKRHGYEREEILDTLFSMYGMSDDKISDKIKEATK